MAMAVSSVSSRANAYTTLVRPAPKPIDEVMGAAGSRATGESTGQAAGLPAERSQPVINTRGETTGRIINTTA
jgi:hypothetical protein